MSQRMVVERLSTFARDIAVQPDGPSSISRAVDLASKVLDCSLVDIVRVRTTGGLRVVGSVDPDRSDRLVRMPDATADGPAEFCRSAMGTAVVTDLRGDDRWPGYTLHMSKATDLQGEMDIGLDIADGDPVVLRFFSEQPDAWSDEDRRDATAFAELAALAIDRAGLRTTAHHLREALTSNRVIGAATGILMARRQVTYEVGFELLRSASQHSNRKLGVIADDVVLTGDLPEGDERLREEQKGREIR